MNRHRMGGLSDVASRLGAAAGVLGIALTTACGGADLGPGPRFPEGDTCAAKAFEATVVQESVKPNVVRIVAEDGSGTGFVLSTPQDGELLIATNHHVVAEADKYSALFVSPTGQKTEVAGLEVVKVDTKNDLALLKAPRIQGMVKGLYLNPTSVKLGERVAAMGYPYVKGSDDFALTFEPGDVSAVEREFEKRKFIQTNANINPGNSGGPVLDSCGSVVGVVTAIHKDAERIGLVVPVSHLLVLYGRYTDPREPAQSAVPTQIASLEKAVKWRDGSEAAQLFSRSYMRDTVFDDFMRFLKAAKDKENNFAQVLAQGDINYNEAPLDVKMKFLKDKLPPDEFLAWTIGQAISLHAMGAYEGLQRYLSAWIADSFGEVTSMKVVDIHDANADKADARVEIKGARGEMLYEFAMVYEWGDWRIARMSCVRGCPAN